MKKKNLHLLILFTVLLVVSACGNKDDGMDYVEFYKLNESKLAAEVIDQTLEIGFKPPMNWSLMPAELSRKTETHLRNNNPQEQQFAYQPVYLFFNDSTGSLMSVGFVDYPDTVLNSVVKLNYYKNLLSKKYQGNKLVVSNFSHTNISFSQFKNEKGNFINYKIIFSNPQSNIVQFDCTIPAKHLEEELNLLKACIGSIKLVRTQ